MHELSSGLAVSSVPSVSSLASNLQVSVTTQQLTSRALADVVPALGSLEEHDGSLLQSIGEFLLPRVQRHLLSEWDTVVSMLGAPRYVTYYSVYTSALSCAVVGMLLQLERVLLHSVTVHPSYLRSMVCESLYVLWLASTDSTACVAPSSALGSLRRLLPCEGEAVELLHDFTSLGAFLREAEDGPYCEPARGCRGSDSPQQGRGRSTNETPDDSSVIVPHTCPSLMHVGPVALTQSLDTRLQPSSSVSLAVTSGSWIGEDLVATMVKSMRTPAMRRPHAKAKTLSSDFSCAVRDAVAASSPCRPSHDCIQRLRDVGARFSVAPAHLSAAERMLAQCLPSGSTEALFSSVGEEGKENHC